MYHLETFKKLLRTSRALVQSIAAHNQRPGLCKSLRRWWKPVYEMIKGRSSVTGSTSGWFHRLARSQFKQLDFFWMSYSLLLLSYHVRR